MDDRGCRKWSELPRKSLHFVALLSFFSFLYSYSSASPSYNLHLSTFIFSLFAHAVDRNYVFLVCNLILAFLAKNLTFHGSTNPAADAPPHQNTLNQMPAILLSPNAPECTCHPLHQHNLQEDDDDDQEEEVDLKEDETQADQGSSTVEEVTDASVSTEELQCHYFHDIDLSVIYSLVLKTAQHFGLQSHEQLSRFHGPKWALLQLLFSE